MVVYGRGYSGEAQLSLSPDERQGRVDTCLERFAGRSVPLRTLGLALLADALYVNEAINCIRDLWWEGGAPVVMAKGARGVVAAFPHAEELEEFNGQRYLTSLRRPRVRSRAMRRAGPGSTSVHEGVEPAIATECRWLRRLDQQVSLGVMAAPRGAELARTLGGLAERVVLAEMAHNGGEDAAQVLCEYQVTAQQMRECRARVLQQLRPLILNNRMMQL